MPDSGESPRAPVAILGAGLTGLSAAHRLGQLDINCSVFERRMHVGGHAATTEVAGYRFDRTGHALHLRHPEIREMLLAWIGQECLTVQRQSRVWSHGVYTRYPFQANAFGLPPAVANECVLGFIRAHCAQPASPPNNFEEYCQAYFGEGISKHFMLPYNSRLWGVHPREISGAWCDRFVPRPELEDVIAGAVGLNRGELGYNVEFIYPRRGIGQLAQALHQRVAHVELGRAPTQIDYRRRRLHFPDETIGYDVLINTTPLPVLIDLLGDPPAAVGQARRALRHTHLYYLDVALAAPCRQPLHWVYVPEAKYPFYRVGCYSNFSPQMAPAGKANLYVELVDRREPHLDQLLPRVAAALVEMGIIGAAREVEFAHLRKIDYAYVIFDHAYFACLDAIRPFLEQARIVSAGRYGAWNYSSMEDALIDGRNAAARAQKLL